MFLTMTQQLGVDEPGHTITNQVTDLLQKAGLRVSPTFSLQSARAGTACTRHINSCHCNLQVFLVYGAESLLARQVVESHSGRTWFSLVENPGAAASPELNSACGLKP
jgi:hypothetical protein